MKSLYVELNGSYVEVGEVKIPELVSAKTKSQSNLLQFANKWKT